MKKVLSFILALILLTTSAGVMPLGVFAADTEQSTEVSNNEEYFLPVIVDNDGKVYQGGEELSSEDNKGEILVATDEITGVDESIKEQEYVSVDEIAKEIGAEKVEDNGKTVYVKPFQTKTLIVNSSGRIPNTNPEKKTKNFDGSYSLEYETEEETEKAYEILKNSKNVDEVNGENVYSISNTGSDEYSYANKLSWGSEYVNSPQIVEYADKLENNEELVVAIVDTGIDTGHPFFKGRISSKGYNFVNNNSIPEDGEGHGTHCAGIVVDNTPKNVKIMALKGLDNDGYGDDSDLAKCINYAVENGADVISMSWGGYDFWTGSVLKSAIVRAYNAGVVLVAAAGNESDNAYDYFPAKSSYCITVGATDKNGRVASFSNYGACVDVSAPGVAIKSTYKGGGYKTLSGTSMATPLVAAAVATDFTINGKDTPSDEKKRIKEKVTPFSVPPAKSRGTGIIDYTYYTEAVFTRPVTFSVKSGYYENEFTVELSCSEENAKIYYDFNTVTGYNPTLDDKTGTLYTGPLTVSENTTITAVAYAPGKNPSKRTKAEYRFNDYDFIDRYEVNSDGVLTEYNGVLKKVAVPEYVKGVRVVGVGENAFADGSYNEVVLPDSVKRIGANAFGNCYSLEKVVCHNAKALGNECFDYCSKLKIIEDDNIESIGSACFRNCSAFDETSVNLEKLKLIPSEAFRRTNISNVEFNNVTSVGAAAFSECSNIVSVVLPRLEIIGDGAFRRCASLETIRLDEIKAVASNAFANCTKLKTAHFENVKTFGRFVFENCTSLKNVNAPKLEESDGSFSGTGLEVINLPSLKKIGDYEFMDNKYLKEVNIGSVEVLSHRAFRNCPALEKVPDCFKDVKIIETEAFNRCTGLKEAKFESAEYVSGDAFEFATSLETLELPKCKIAKIELNSSHLKELSLPVAKEVTLELDNTCTLSEIELPKAETINIEAPNVEKLYAPECRYFQGLRGTVNKIKDFYAPKLIEITASSFSSCSELEEINLVNVRKINGILFSNCPKLKYVYLPHCESSVKEMVMNNTNNIEYIYAPNIVSFGGSCFNRNGSVKYLYIPKAREMNAAISGLTAVKELNLKSAEKGSVSAENSDAPALNVHAPFIDADISLLTDLPSEFTSIADNYTIFAQAKCSIPSYEWYYSENGEDFRKLEADRYNIVPSKDGYYYCKITDEKTGQSVVTSVCNVTLSCELAELTLSFGDYDCCVRTDKEFFEAFKDGEKLSLPKGTEVTLLTDMPNEKISVGEVEVSSGNGGFTFAADNVTIKPVAQKLITKDMVTVNSCVVDAKDYSTRTIPEYVIKDGDYTLVENKDYTISFYENSYAHTEAPYTVIGMGDWAGVVNGTFDIEKFDISNCSFGKIEDQIYSGLSIRPVDEGIWNNGKLLKNWIRIWYDNNVLPGKATAYARGINSCTGNLYSNFIIYATNDMMSISIEKDSYLYTSKPIVPNFDVIFLGNYLEKDKDYTVVCKNNTEVGTATATVILKEPYYRGSETFEFEIVQHTHSQADAVKENNIPATCTVNGSYDEVVYCSVCGEELSRKTITVNALGHKPEEAVIENNIPATCTVNGSYNEVVYCSICGKEISRKKVTVNALGHKPEEAVIENNIPATCTVNGSYNEVIYCSICGKEISRKKVTVKATGHNIVTDNAIPATYLHKGKTEGSHCGICNEILVEQKVIPKRRPPKTKLTKATGKKKSIVLKWKKRTKNVNGYRIQYSLDSKFKSGNKKVTVKKNKTLSKTLKNLKSKRTYYVRIRTYKIINGKKYYSAWSKKLKVKTK